MTLAAEKLRLDQGQVIDGEAEQGDHGHRDEGDEENASSLVRRRATEGAEIHEEQAHGPVPQFLVVKLAVKRWPGKLSLAVQITPGMSRSKRRSKSGVTTWRPGSHRSARAVGQAGHALEEDVLSAICVATLFRAH